MELILIVAFVGALLRARWLQGRRAGAARFEPWVAIVGALVLLVLAWASGPVETGPRIILTAGTLLGIARAASLLRDRRRGRQLPRARRRPYQRHAARPIRVPQCPVGGRRPNSDITRRRTRAPRWLRGVGGRPGAHAGGARLDHRFPEGPRRSSDEARLFHPGASASAPTAAPSGSSVEPASRGVWASGTWACAGDARLRYRLSEGRDLPLVLTDTRFPAALDDGALGGGVRAARDGARRVLIKYVHTFRP